MKKIFVTSILSFTTVAFLGMSQLWANSADQEIRSQPSEKAGKCGTSKCGNSTKAPKSKCGTGKCGDAKKMTPKPKATGKCGVGKCG